MTDNALGKRWVVKIGSSLVTDDGRGLQHEAIRAWVAELAQLRAAGYELVLVSSGAVAEGLVRLGWDSRPTSVPELQAAAAVGQMGVAEAWQGAFDQYDTLTAQVLVTHEDIRHRDRYLNARVTLRTLLDLNVVPVVNENDTVATDEIRLGDNDTLGALVANLVEADALIILTDQAGLFTADPRSNPDAELIADGIAGDTALAMGAGGGGALGRGGMITKLTAADKAARSGAMTVIASGKEPQLLTRLAAGEALGTRLRPAQAPLAARKQWIAGHLQVLGQLHLDAGAVRVLQQQGRSLLPVGVSAVAGEFERGDVVSCISPEGVEVARGLVNYSAQDAAKIVKTSSDVIAEVLGFSAEPEMVHRDNMVLLDQAMPQS